MRTAFQQLQCPSGLFDNVKWSVPVEGLTNSYADLARQEFGRFVVGYTRRLQEFISLTERAHTPEADGDRARETQKQLELPAAPQPARALLHYDRNVAPRFAAAKGRLSASSLTDVTAMRSVADVLLGIAESMPPDSADMEHWVFSAGRQYVETLEAKGLVEDAPPAQLSQAAREDVPLSDAKHMEHALAA